LQNEVRVGAFFIATAALVAVVFIFLSDYMGRWSSQTVTAHFVNVAGLQTGTEVRLSGVRIGRVLRIVLEDHVDFPGRSAQVVMSINRDVILYEDDAYYVEQGAVIGDKYISIARSASRHKTRLADGSHVAGAGLAGLSGLPEDAQDLMAAAKRTLHNIEQTFVGPERAMQIDQIVRNVISLTAQADAVSGQALHFARNLAAMSDQARPEIAEMARNLSAASQTLNTTTLLVQGVVATSPVPKNIALASGNIATSTEDIKAVTQNLAQVLADPDLTAQLEQAMINLGAATENLAGLTEQANRLVSDDQGVGQDMREAMAQLRQAASDLAEVSGHVREVLTDPELTDNLKVSMAKTRETMEQAAEVGAKASTSLDRVDSTMDRLSGAVSALRPRKVDTMIDTLVGSNHGFRADLTADLYYSSKERDFWRIGIHNIGDTDKLTLQKSMPMSGFDNIRMGIYAGKPAIGYDRRLSSRFNAELDLWDPDNHKFDMRLRYHMRPSLDLTIGAHEVLSGTDPFVGLRYHFRQSKDANPR
jgi:phospholipid/cholesterol/gamma-HCH transport system substrate-binding protein